MIRSPSDRSDEPGLPSSVDPVLRRAVATGSTVRFAGSAAAVACMTLTGVVVARGLGPTGKGVVSTLSYLSALAASVTTLGLGDAATVRYGKRPAELRTATWATVVGTIAAGSVGVVATVLVGSLFVDSGELLLLTGLSVVFTSLMTNLSRLAEANDRVAFASLVFAVFAATTAAASVLLVTVLGTGAQGALVALLAGPIVGCVLLAWQQPRHSMPSGTARAVRTVRTELAHLLPVGAPMMAADFLRSLLRRADVLVVYALADAAAAGIYSVAVTFGELALYAPAAVATATFPTVARFADEQDAGRFVAEVTRGSIVVAGVAAVPLAAVSPILLPAVFGPGFAGSVVPGVVLVLGSVIMSVQWVLARSAGARGRPEVLFRSYLLATVTMLALDLALVPSLGPTGAALAAVLGAGAGCVVVIIDLRRGDSGVPLRTLVPTPSDAARIVRFLKALRRSR